jgi:PBP1b-binding outer membrane lipoprotein LpoB
MKFKLWISMIILTLVLVGCSATEAPKEDVQEDQVAVEQLNEGELAVNFEFLDYDGNTIKLSDLEGQKVY